jgi:hemolysin activation/secretion protein
MFKLMTAAPRSQGRVSHASGKRRMPGFASYLGTICAIPGLLMMIPLSAQAQQIQLPSGAEPGRAPLEPVLPQSEAPRGAIAIPQTPAAQAPAGAETYHFVLTSLDIQGVTAFPKPEMSELSRGLTGTTVSVRDMFEIANKLELRYRTAGYVTTRVIIPAQTIEHGRFRIKVVEGTISDIVFHGKIGPAERAVRSLLSFLRQQRPVSIGAIERGLLLANDLPGLTVRANLEPSKQVLGGSVLVVTMARKAVDASVSVDNRSTPYVGAYEYLPSASVKSFGSHADQVSLSAKVSSPLKREWLVAGGYQRLLNGNGLTFNFNSDFSRSVPGAELDALNVHSRVLSETAGLTYPIIRSRRQNLRLSGEFEYRDVVTDLSGALFNRDHLRILRTGLSYDRTDSWNGITAARVTMHQGLGILGATSHNSQFASRADGNSQYTKFTAGLTRLQDLGGPFSMLASVTGQLTNVPLLASEQIALGGPNFGRAYDQGEISGDKGWAGLIEARYTPAVPKLLPHGLQFYGFFDGGEVWNISNIAPLTGGHTLTSVGGGLRLNPTSYLYTSVEVAQALDRQITTQGGKPTRIFFTVTARY